MAQEIKEGTEVGKRISKAELLKRVSDIKTAQDFARFMATLMAALIAGEIDAATGNAICKAASNILKAIEMQIKFGGGKALALTDGDIPSMMPVKRIPATTQPAKDPRASRDWCHDCYNEGKLYIKATEEESGEPVCLPHFNKRKRELEEDDEDDRVIKERK